jgi:hypothetical protein
MVDQERVTSWPKQALADCRIGGVCKLECKTAIVTMTDRELKRLSIMRQSQRVVWKSCVMVDRLMEQVVEELAPRLPYPLRGHLMIAVDRGARKDEVEVQRMKRRSTQVGL